MTEDPHPGGVSSAPEHNWAAAAAVLLPILRPVGTSGIDLESLDPERLAIEGMKSHARPVVDEGPGGLAIAYALRASAFDILVNADHILAWGATPAEVRAAAMANLAAWSASAPWTDEVAGRRRLLASASGDGGDAVRVLLPEVRAHLHAELGSDGRILVAVPERDLLLAGCLTTDDEEFGALFAAFVRDHADGTDQPIDQRVFELVDGELVPFVP
ncbi:MAG: hypothetical protein ABIV26_03765 [Candidatus Limnocylindrales bacterium]